MCGCTWVTNHLGSQHSSCTLHLVVLKLNLPVGFHTPVIIIVSLSQSASLNWNALYVVSQSALHAHMYYDLRATGLPV